MPFKIEKSKVKSKNSNFFLVVLPFTFCLLNFSSFASEPPKYEIDANIDTANHKITAQEKVVFTNNTKNPINAIYFHIYPHRKYTEEEKRFLMRYAGYFKINPYPEGFQSGDLKINSILSNNKNLNYAIEGDDETILKVELPQRLLSTESIELNIDFSVDIPHAYGRFGWHTQANKRVIALHRWYPILSFLGEEGWHNYPFYPYHQPYLSESSIYKVKITLPQEEIAAHTGIVSKEVLNKDGTKTIFIESDLAVRDFSLSLSPAYQIYSLDSAGVKINVYYFPEDQGRGREAAECARDLFQYYAKNFGDYPYKEFSLASVYLGYGGHETSNMAFIDTRVYKLPKFLSRYFDFLISHETGHQWWFNLVGSDEYKETWLDEAINSWCLLGYLENKYGKDAQVMVLPKSLSWLIPNFSFRYAGRQRYLYIAKNGLDRAVLGELSSFQEPSSVFSLAYGKGEAIVEMLDSLLGREKFSKVMKDYFSEFRFKIASVEDFKKLCEKDTNRDLDWFFQEWLATDKKCDYAIKSVGKEGIILENKGAIKMPIETEIKFSDGRQTLDKWDGQGAIHKIPLDSAAKIKSVQIHDQEPLLDLDKTNNSWPRKFYLKAVPLYFFAYEIPVFLPDDAYNLVYGPYLADSGFGAKASLQKPYDNIFSLSSTFDFNEVKINSTLLYEIKHVFEKQMNLGFEFFNNDELGGKDDARGGKIYLRRELWPASYGLFEVNDHITFYILRDEKLTNSGSFGGLEDIENLWYRKAEEAIVGATLSFNRGGPYPDPTEGYKLESTLESAGHFFGGKEYFNRWVMDFAKYFSFIPQQKLATKIKLGLGMPQDKPLFQLGGDQGLRGYERKTINGSNAILGSIEYRFPLIQDLNFSFFDNVLHLTDIQAVPFFDIGKSWAASFSDPAFKKDAGLGFRFYFNLGAFLERVAVRLDIAQAINDSGEDTHFWFGLNHTF